MTRWIYSVAASLALVAAGVVHGFWTDRWVGDARLTDAAARLADIPTRIGDWEGSEIEVKPNQVGAGVTGHAQRRYHNVRTGATVAVAIVNGRPGPVATHTPEACYGAAGYVVGKRAPVELDTPGGPARFWTSDATRTRATDETKVRIYWAWNGGDGWTASGDARREFSRYRYPVLHKLYVLRDLNEPSTNAGKDKDEPCVAFLNALVPALDRALFPKDG
ncbi:MAG: exosortase-associated EpsI family protein [Gemmataceae bacterium]